MGTRTPGSRGDLAKLAGDSPSPCPAPRCPEQVYAAMFKRMLEERLGGQPRRTGPIRQSLGPDVGGVERAGQRAIGGCSRRVRAMSLPPTPGLAFPPRAWASAARAGGAIFSIVDVAQRARENLF